MKSNVVVVVCVGVVVALAGRGHGQDFPAPVPHAGPGSASEFLERGLPALESWDVAVAGVRRFGLAELETRALSARAGWRSLRAAAGVSQTGGPELGWWSCGSAAGFATGAAGAGVKALARRDRATPNAPAFEAGGGAWIVVGRGHTVWIAHPQGMQRGASPLSRGLEIGVRWTQNDFEVWLARESAADGAGVDRHRAGGALIAGPARVVLELREAPLRVSVGVSARRGGLGAAASVDEHPILPGTTRLGVSLGPAP